MKPSALAARRPQPWGLRVVLALLVVLNLFGQSRRAEAALPLAPIVTVVGPVVLDYASQKALEHIKASWNLPPADKAALNRGLQVAKRTPGGWRSAAVAGVVIAAAIAALKQDYVDGLGDTFGQDAGWNDGAEGRPEGGIQWHDEDGIVRAMWVSKWTVGGRVLRLGGHTGDPGTGQSRVFMTPGQQYTVYDTTAYSWTSTGAPHYGSWTVVGPPILPSGVNPKTGAVGSDPDSMWWEPVFDPATNPRAPGLLGEMLGDATPTEPSPSMPTIAQKPGTTGSNIGDYEFLPNGLPEGDSGIGTDPFPQPEPEPEPSPSPSANPSPNPTTAPTTEPSPVPDTPRGSFPAFEAPFFVSHFLSGVSTKFPFDLITGTFSYQDPDLKFEIWGYEHDINWMKPIIGTLSYIAVIGLIIGAIIAL